jgi:hypothetical protein
MPIVRVDIPAGYDDATKSQLRDRIKQDITEALDSGQQGRHPETLKWIYVSITEAFAELGDGLPTVTVDTRPRPYEMYQKLAQLMVATFEDILGTPDVYLLLREEPAPNHIACGEPLPEWRPDG